MKWMLDTNICIYLIKKHPNQVVEKFEKCRIDDICLSSISLAELEYGVSKSLHVAQNRIALAKFLLPFEIACFDDLAAREHGEIRAKLEQAGKPIGAYDLLIAAHAVSLGITLITNNVREFKRIPNLTIENWV